VCVAVEVTTQLPGARGYTGGKVIFIDTENTLCVTHAQLMLHMNIMKSKLNE